MTWTTMLNVQRLEAVVDLLFNALTSQKKKKPKKVKFLILSFVHGANPGTGISMPWKKAGQNHSRMWEGIKKKKTISRYSCHRRYSNFVIQGISTIWTKK